MDNNTIAMEGEYIRGGYMQLIIRGEADKTTARIVLYAKDVGNKPAKTYTLGDGITKTTTDGEFILTITEADSMLLPAQGVAMLQGWLMPNKQEVYVSLGRIVNNIADE